MTTYGYARVSRGRDDGTGPLQNQRLWLTVDAGRIHQDIITGTVFQRPGLNGLLDAIQAGDVLVLTAPLDRLGRDTLSLLELKVLEMLVDAQDEAGAGAGPGGGQAGWAVLEHLADADRTIQRMRKDMGMSLAQIAQGQGVSESLVRRVLKIEDVEALPATAFKGGWD